MDLEPLQPALKHPDRPERITVIHVATPVEIETAPKFAYVEEQGPIRYFPKPTRFVYHALRFKRKVWRDPRALVTMIGRVQRP